MKSYIETLVVKGKKGDGKFSGLILNSEGKLEFKQSNIFSYSEISFVFDEEREGLQMAGIKENVLIKLTKENVDKLIAFKKEITKSLNGLFKNIISGEEKLICYPLELEEYPYFITTETIIKEGMYSPKYTKGLEYAFSDVCLKKFEIDKLPGFKDYGDLQKRLGEAIVGLKLEEVDYQGEKVIITTLKEVLVGVK